MLTIDKNNLLVSNEVDFVPVPYRRNEYIKEIFANNNLPVKVFSVDDINNDPDHFREGYKEYLTTFKNMFDDLPEDMEEIYTLVVSQVNGEYLFDLIKDNQADYIEWCEENPHPLNDETYAWIEYIESKIDNEFADGPEDNEELLSFLRDFETQYYSE